MRAFARQRRGARGSGLYLCLAVLCVTLAIPSIRAFGAQAVFVDGGGICAGFAPCFTTIQNGVNNAGPPPAVVNVFPGDYAESVDLGLMGSAIAGSTGDLTLRTVDAAGDAALGTARILPATGKALFNSLISFNGNLSIRGFTVKSPNDDGIDLGLVLGSLELIGIISNANAGFGLSAGFSGGNVRIQQSSFSNNGDTGMNFGVAGDVTFDRVTADANQNDGAAFSLFGDMHATGSSFSNNKNRGGLSFGTAVDVTLERVTADGNGTFGTTFGVNGNVEISDSSFSNNKNAIGLSFGTAVDVTVDRVAADGNAESGAGMGASGNVLIRNSTFSSNMEGGLSVGGAEVRIFASRFEDNGAAGVRLGPSNPTGEYVLRCNDVARNGDGLVVTAPAIVEAEENYWGSPTGPTHPSNPAGTGDTIRDAANGGSGTVDFEPFLTIPASQSGQCVVRPAPLLDRRGLLALLLGLFVLASLRLARRARSNAQPTAGLR